MNISKVNVAKNDFFKIFIGLLITFNLFSCGGEAVSLDGSSLEGGSSSSGSNTGSGSSSSSSSSGSSSSSSSGSEEQGGVDEAADTPTGYSDTNFYAGMSTEFPDTNLTSILDDFDDRCEFTTSSVVDDITCGLEVNELSLYYNGLKIIQNAPAGMCRYVRKYPYWYYKHEVGYGPSTVTVNITLDESGTTILKKECGSAHQTGINTSNCSDSTATVMFAEKDGDINPICIYDNTEYGGTNCCLGSYTLTKTTTVSGQTPTATVTPATWGSSVKECIGGPGASNWDLFTKSGYPRPAIIPAKDGYKQIYEVTGPLFLTDGAGYNIPAANYYTTGMHTHNGYATLSASSSTLPFFIDPIGDRRGNALLKGNPEYIFDCLDEALEVTKRIRMYVREWNTLEEYTKYITSGTASLADPDVVGSSPGNCVGVAGLPCNDIEDNDDFVTSLGGSYNTVSATNSVNFPGL